ncbi:MAG: hypothetical protein Q9168_007977 [Polycauliona sp. 1 TL-2023]
MDQLICIIDATTLVENIQEIKRLVLQDQIRLVVPLCTATALERKYANFKEEANKKPPRQVEPQRPRPSGKQAKVEPPAFDLNPFVAGEFLARLRSREQSTVEFQKDNEEYSPWKLMESEEEIRNTAENRPATFAQAVQKQNIERLLNSNGAGNGIMKPRLVARTAANDGSPWKKALALPISDVPKDARPIFSCLLWRLHEKGVTRWDTDRTTLLCNSQETNSLAKKLGIPARSTTEIRTFCDTRRLGDMRETSGNLEEDFGIQKKVRVVATNNHVEKPEEIATSLPKLESSEDRPQEKPSSQLDKTKTPSMNSTQSNVSNATAKSSESEKQTASAEKLAGQRDSKFTDDSKLSEGKLDVAIETILNGGEKRNVPGLLVTSTDKGKSVAALGENGHTAAEPIHSNPSSLDPEKEHSIAAWVRSLMSNGDLSGRNSPVSGSSTVAPEIEPVQDFKPLTYRQAVTGKVEEAIKKQAPPSVPKEMITSPAASPVRDPSPPKVKMEDPVDSDEEIVVFNPKAKRLSAQKAQQAQQVQQTQKTQQPRPTQSQQTQQTQSPQQLLKAQQPRQTQQVQQVPQVQQIEQAQQVQQGQPNPRPQTPTASPKINHVRHVSGGRPQSRGTAQRQPRPGPPPVVIDPDSFGRDLLTNPQPNIARTFSPYGAHGRIPNHHRGNHRPVNPRAHIQNTTPRTDSSGIVDASGNGNVQRTPEQQSSGPSEPAPAAEVHDKQTPPRAVTTPPTVLEPSPLPNGSSNGPPSSAPTGPGLTTYGSPNVNIRPDRPRYSPRGSPRYTPAAPEGEIPFVLRSGQPRDMTRGRGKLWVP